MEEIWKDVENYEGKYQVSNLGKIKNLKLNKVYIGSLVGRNVLYRYFNMGYVHRIVAKAFIPNPENKPEIDHIDYNPLNNNVTNLRWVTHSENQIHSKERLSLSRQGEKHPLATLTDDEVLNIRKLRNRKIRCKIIAELYGITENNVSNLTTRNYKHLPFY